MGLKELESYPDISFIENMSLEEMKGQLVNDFCERYGEITGKGISLAKADPVRLVLYAAALQLYQGMQYIDNAAKQSFLKYSYGDFLENLGALKGIRRNPGTPARTVVRFTLSEAREGFVVIPMGTRVTPGGTVFFYTQEEAVIQAGELWKDVPAVCSEIGECGNGYEAGSIRTLVDKIPYMSDVRNVEASREGAEAESDGNLAERIYLAPSRYSVAGPDDAYRYWVKAYNPSIMDVKVTSPKPGDVDIRFVLEEGELPDPGMVEAVRVYLSEGERRPLTDRVSVGIPEVFGYGIDVRYWINESDRNKAPAIQRNVEEAVTGYVYWQKRQIGRDINPSMLNHLVVQAGAKRTEIREPVFTVVGDVGLAVASSRTVVYGGIERD